LKAAILAAGIALLPLIANSQGIQTVLVQQPIHARQLDGYVRLKYDQSGIPDVHVEERDAGWKHVLNSTITDDSGHFHLVSSVKGSTHYLRLTATGYNMYFYTVKLSKHASPELELELTVGT
jgi:hypothetical protein